MLYLWDIAKWLGVPALLLALLFSGTLRSCLLPFVLALMTASALRRPISRLESHLPRWLAAFIVMTLSGLLLLCGLTLLTVKLWQDLPALLSGFSNTETLWMRLEQFALRLPGFLRSGAVWLLEQLQTQGSALTQQITTALAETAADWASALPGLLFGLGIFLLASFYAAADWPRVCQGLKRLVPAQWRPGTLRLLERLKEGAQGWLWTQGRLMAITYGLLLAGFFLLRIPGPWAAALAVALADALPFFGSGILLVPWAALVFFQGESGLALGLLALWGAATLVRSVLEPRFLGKQAGVSPLLTLLVLYAGLKLFGLPGLILGPIALSAVMSALH